MSDRKVFVGNLTENVTEELLYELFLQAGPVDNVKIPFVKGRQSMFGFVEFTSSSSVLYAIDLLDGISLFGRSIKVNEPLGKGAAGGSVRDSHPPPNMYTPPPPFHMLPSERPSREHKSNNFDRGDFRERLGGDSARPSYQPRHRQDNHMKPSKRPNRSRAPSPPLNMNDIPDFLNNGPVYPRHHQTDRYHQSDRHHQADRHHNNHHSHHNNYHRRDQERNHRHQYPY